MSDTDLLQKLTEQVKSYVPDDPFVEFNIFSALSDHCEEVRLHSRFISYLLAPNSPHNKGVLFLNEFLKTVKSSFVINTDSIEVHPNYYRRTEYKYIDISIIDRIQHKAIIIENKINAADREGQLERYCAALVNEDLISFDNIEVYYLTVDGREPSENSTDYEGIFPQLKNKVRRISYESEILSWLDAVIPECSADPPLQQALNQYEAIVKDICRSDMKKYVQAVTELLTTDADMCKTIGALFKYKDELQFNLVKLFLNDLKQEMSCRDIECLSTSSDEEIRSENDDYGCCFCKDNLIFRIYFHYYDGILFFGIFRNDSPEFAEAAKKTATELKTESTSEWPLWFYFCRRDNDEYINNRIQYGNSVLLFSTDLRSRIIKSVCDEAEKVISIILHNNTKIHS